MIASAPMAPRIGIPPSLDAAGRWRPGRRFHYLDAAYAEAVAEAGGVPVYLAAPGPAGAQIAAVDGLLLPGGPDFLPAGPYPEGVAFAPAPDAQLAFDRALLAAARAAALPLLGVCYGMQLLALESGGALHHHLPLDLPGSLEHQCADPAARHRVALVPGTRLALLFAAAEIAVNSRHHQAVSAPGRGLAVAARSADGVIEAIEAAGGTAAPFLVGVQWHPESLEREHRRALFGAFVSACSERSPF
jgi:putative glutamine amidotransferase